MNIVNLAALPWEEQRSPTGKFHSYCQNISLALGGKRDVGLAGGGQPFDVQIRRVPPGAAVCPLHAHEIQCELFMVLSGTATVRVNQTPHGVGVGDIFYQAPRTPHQITNHGPEDFVFYVIADNPVADSTYYPDSNKWAMKPQRTLFRMTTTHYFDGEDSGPPPTGGPWNMAAPASSGTDLTRVQVDQLPWEPWSSPAGKFGAESKQISEALGARKNMPTGLGGHPFDVELNRLAPGQKASAFHSHAAQWEMFIILTGTGQVRAGDESRPVTPGDILLHPPGEAHQLINTGASELTFYIIADNPLIDIFYYPDSDKWGARPLGKHFRLQVVDYENGE